MSKKKNAGFNSPFAAASEKLRTAAELPPPTPQRKTPIAPPAPPRPPSRSEEEIFADEMLGVQRIDPDPRGRMRAPEPLPAIVSRRAVDDAEAYAELADLAEGSGPFSISDTDEYLEFLAPGVNRQILRKLRRGDYAMQDHLDLHGMTREEAHLAVERFIERSRSRGTRSVLIVHGRGLNSKDQIPVLKERVKAWLERGRIGRQVLAFASARPCDGGTGALYVLLRK